MSYVPKHLYLSFSYTFSLEFFNDSYVRWIDYIQGKRKGTNQPIFVYSILFACTITLMVSIAINDWKFESMTLNPSFGPSAETLIIMGAKHSGLIVNGHEIWRLFTPMFLRKCKNVY